MPPERKAGQTGDHLTTAQGLRLPDTDHSLKAGSRGPTLMEDFHLREKITHFDHERIPERAVHARGAAAHGTFTAYGNAASVTKAGFLQEDRETPVFVSFSTVLGSRGSADLDLVGNNMPVFFVQDGIKFPDIIHAGKPHPDRELPQAQTAHDTFWDFVSLHTEATHHVMWAMSDRGMPRSQLAAGTDPDFHRRDLADGIEAGAPLEFELGLQVFPDSAEETFEGIDLLGPTKIVPEELAEVHLVGRLTLDRNPTNYFAETEQVAVRTGNLVPGIEVTNDPLMQARLFSYLDTQLTRLGGPNFTQLPINCPHAAVNDNLRDGMHQTVIHHGIAPYLPNSIDGSPQPASEPAGGYVQVPREVEGPVVRESPVSFADHLSQATLFWLSMTGVEKAHIVEAFTFELGKCYEQPIRERMLGVLANVDADLCSAVAEGLGLPAPTGQPADAVPSPALSQLTSAPGPIAGRVIGVVAASGADLAGITSLRRAVEARGAVLRVLAPAGGVLGKGSSQQIVERTFLTTRSIEYDAVVVAGGTADLSDPKLSVLLAEVFRHCKVIGAWGDGVQVLTTTGVDTTAAGVVLGEKIAKPFTSELLDAVGRHGVWDRA